MKSTLITSLGENADGLQIDIDSNGRMTILPNAEDVNKYNIQIAPDGRSAELAIQRPDGVVDVVQLDEKGMASINEALGGADEAVKLRDPNSRFPTLDDIKPQFAERLPINPELGHLPGERFILEFDPKAAGNTVDVARAAASADNVADVVRAVNAATDALKVGKVAGKTAKLSIVGGVALTGGVAALLHYAHSSQRGLAETLNENGQLSDEALEEYVALNKEVEAEMQAENLAGQGWLFLITTPAVEASARAKFDEFSAKHNLSAETHDALAMSIFKGESLSAQFAGEAIDMMPDSMSEVDPELQHLWRLTKDLEEAESDRRVAHQPPVAYGGGMYGGYHPYDPNREERKTQTDEALKEAKFEHQAEFARLLVDPDTGSKVLSMMPQDVLIDMVEESAQYHSEGQDPLIQRIGELQRQINSDETGFIDEWGLKSQRDDALEELKSRPEVLHAYIRNVFGDDTASRNPSPELQRWNNADPDATFATMPDYMQMRAMDVAAKSVGDLENTDDVHPYLEELSVLQKRVDNDHIGSSWRESNNERIQEIKSELLQNPRVLAEYAQQSPEVQSVFDEYNANKADYDRYSDVTPAEVKQTFEVMREAAVEHEGDIGVSQQHPMLKELGDLYYERSQKSFYEWIDKPDLDARIEQRELELQQRPDILSDYMKQKIGDDLVSQAAPNSTNDSLMHNFNGQSVFDYAITPTSLSGLSLPNDLGVSDVQGGAGYTSSGDYTLHPQSLELNPQGAESELMISPAEKTLNSTVLNTDDIDRQIEEIRATEYTVPDVRLSPQVYPLNMVSEELSANIEDQAPNQSSESDYVAVAITMQRLQSGEPIDAVEQQEVEAILNNPDSAPELIAMIEENYPSEAAILMSTQDAASEEVIPQISMQQSTSSISPS